MASIAATWYYTGVLLKPHGGSTMSPTQRKRRRPRPKIGDVLEFATPPRGLPTPSLPTITQ